MILTQEILEGRARKAGVELRYRYNGWANAKCFVGNNDQWVLFGKLELTTYPNLMAVAKALTKMTAIDGSGES